MNELLFETRDLHSGNVLYSTGPLIGDLGLCVLKAEASGIKDIAGVMPYMAPELLSGRGSYSRATDVYAFGIIMCEISTGEKPFGEFEHDVQLALSIVKGLRPEPAEDTPPFYQDLLEKCWHPDPKKRPTAQEIYIVTSKWNYPTPEVREQLEKAQETRKRTIGLRKEAKKIHPGAIYTSRFMTNITHGKKCSFFI